MPLTFSQFLTLFPIIIATTLVMNWLHYHRSWKEIWKKRILYRITYVHVRPSLPSWAAEASKGSLHQRTLILFGLIVLSAIALNIWRILGWVGLDAASPMISLFSVIWWSMAFSSVLANLAEIMMDVVFRRWALWINTHPDEVGLALEKRDQLKILKTREQLTQAIPPSTKENLLKKRL